MTHEYTSERIAAIAARVLRDPLATEEAKALAGSALTQARGAGAPDFDLHGAIINLQGKPLSDYTINERLAYKAGHRDARHAAAELVLNANARKAGY